MRLFILVGSGLSVPAGYPRTDELTKRVLEGRGVTWNRSTFTVRPDGEESPDLQGRQIIGFLRLLRGYAESTYAMRVERTVNYEDLYYMAEQVRGAATWDFDNPALFPLLTALSAPVGRLLRRGRRHANSIRAMDRLAERACSYIADTVWCLLRPERTIAHHAAFMRFLQDPRLEAIRMFTLNHETLLERRLRKDGIEFIDGFGGPRRGLRYWDPSLFDRHRGHRLHFLKLHGSVDWFLMGGPGGLSDQRYAINPRRTWHPRGPQGEVLDRVHHRPVLAIGTHNKGHEYTRYLLSDLYSEFIRALHRDPGCQVAMLVGYGGQDKFINEQIADWMDGRDDRRLVMVDRSGEKFALKARMALAGRLQMGTWRSRVSYIDGDVRNVSSDRFARAIGLS